MRFLFIVYTILFTGSCQSRTANETSETTKPIPSTSDIAVQADTMCFQQILQRDTTTLRLVVNGTAVKGYLDINPYEKDRARGPVEGRLTGNQIQADWDRAGEGVVQRYAINFTLKGNAITWHEGERIKKQGVWVLKQPRSGYEYVLNRKNCR